MRIRIHLTEASKTKLLNEYFRPKAKKWGTQLAKAWGLKHTLLGGTAPEVHFSLRLEQDKIAGESYGTWKTVHHWRIRTEFVWYFQGKKEPDPYNEQVRNLCLREILPYFGREHWFGAPDRCTASYWRVEKWRGFWKVSLSPVRWDNPHRVAGYLHTRIRAPLEILLYSSSSKSSPLYQFIYQSKYPPKEKVEQMLNKFVAPLAKKDIENKKITLRHLTGWESSGEADEWKIICYGCPASIGKEFYIVARSTLTYKDDKGKIRHLPLPEWPGDFRSSHFVLGDYLEEWIKKTFKEWEIKIR